MKGLLIAGAGGHGKVVADTAYASGCWNNIAFLDDRFPFLHDVLGWPVLGKLEQAADYVGDYGNLVVALGDNLLRVNLIKKFSEIGFYIPVLVHNTAYVSKFAELAAGSVVFAKAVVNAGAKIGLGSIINTGATVDHDCLLGQGVHLSPGVHLAGKVSVGSYSQVGIGTSVIQQVFIGENVLIGAGSVIANNIKNNVVVMGVPGRVVKENVSCK